MDYICKASLCVVILSISPEYSRNSQWEWIYGKNGHFGHLKESAENSMKKQKKKKEFKKKKEVRSMKFPHSAST